ncbi:uncharacterized protein PADG_11949 [Paracoccidioides brasiliensis Pb18]|uniref:Uncharacterized protein n=1 Tax=Paracoccidioides brasiliensis (strain Pb18) TaxID=502780 RepID=A0A0A0HX30_PARBD|nr:uncharacterized protein PADG_11949 [Paracoccidioides brasiliensis Pb18]KGM91970.1 hypothetical protein PADG_11949 [Paracoccidioides brasiliensis Pb18]ODH53121.1 hypothetical protein GX48_00656 [Paracoccidioides brasiliensis]
MLSPASSLKSSPAERLSTDAAESVTMMRVMMLGKSLGVRDTAGDQGHASLLVQPPNKSMSLSLRFRWHFV